MQTTAADGFWLGNRTRTRRDWIGRLSLRGRTWSMGDWIGVGIGALIGPTPFLVALPENHTLVVKTALVGVSVWGAP